MNVHNISQSTLRTLTGSISSNTAFPCWTGNQTVQPLSLPPSPTQYPPGLVTPTQPPVAWDGRQRHRSHLSGPVVHAACQNWDTAMNGGRGRGKGRGRRRGKGRGRGRGQKLIVNPFQLDGMCRAVAVSWIGFPAVQISVCHTFGWRQ